MNNLFTCSAPNNFLKNLIKLGHRALKRPSHKYAMKIFGLCEAKMGHVNYSEMHAGAHSLIESIMAHSVLRTESVNQ